MNSSQLLDRYINAVMKASETQSLTAARDTEEFRQRHVADAQKLLDFFPEKKQ